MTDVFCIIDTKDGYFSKDVFLLDSFGDPEFMSHKEMAEQVADRTELGEDMTLHVILAFDMKAALAGKAEIRNASHEFNLEPAQSGWNVPEHRSESIRRALKLEVA